MVPLNLLAGSWTELVGEGVRLESVSQQARQLFWKYFKGKNAWTTCVPNTCSEPSQLSWLGFDSWWFWFYSYGTVESKGKRPSCIWRPWWPICPELSQDKWELSSAPKSTHSSKELGAFEWGGPLRRLLTAQPQRGTKRKPKGALIVAKTNMFI